MGSIGLQNLGPINPSSCAVVNILKYLSGIRINMDSNFRQNIMPDIESVRQNFPRLDFDGRGSKLL